MAVHEGMKPQDLLVLLKLVSLGPEPQYLDKDLAALLFMSRAELSMSLQRSRFTGLLDAFRLVNIEVLLPFLCQGVRLVYPAKQESLSSGIPTAWSFLKVSKEPSRKEQVVWCAPVGGMQGVAVTPLYKAVPQAAQADARLHRFLALVDYIRLDLPNKPTVDAAREMLSADLKEYQFKAKRSIASL